MHSAILRGTDFVIQSDGQTVRHANFFSGFSLGTRLGLLTPKGLDGLGAANLVLGYVTAFYDRHRENSDKFHAYPEFRTFQCGSQITDYGMLDIYPMEKNIRTKSNPESNLQAIIEQKINILLTPDRHSWQSKINSELIESVKKKVHTCYSYSVGGEVADPDLIIECHKPEIFDWLKAVTETMPDSQATIPSLPYLKQSYRRISLESALRNL